ncbi:bifunctional nuclease family protein [Pseudonocardia sp.]|uniref:bifunctional nuclease family protein n=1 Tax=Pseudonocardia sp. TaxID=60912 RepID=UPI003D136972
MRPMKVFKVIVHARTREPVLVLAEEDGDRCLPVFLRQPQADVIATGPRADDDQVLTQDLIVPTVQALGRRLEGIEITALEDGVFKAALVFDQDTRLAARPSDALAIAVRDGLPIAVADEILDEVGQRVSEMFPNGVDIHEPADRQVAAFREFIEDVSPDDFRSP